MSDLIHGFEGGLCSTIWHPHDIEVCEVITSKLDGKAERITAQVVIHYIYQVELVVLDCQPKTIINCCG